MELLLTGERIDAERAHAMGLVWRVVPHDTLLDEANALARRLLKGAPLAQRAMKEMAMRTRHMATLEAIRFGETMRRLPARPGCRRRSSGRSRATAAQLDLEVPNFGHVGSGRPWTNGIRPDS